MAHIVTAALVIARNGDGQDVYVYQGLPLPAQINAAERKRLVDEGFVEVVADDAGKK